MNLIVLLLSNNEIIKTMISHGFNGKDNGIKEMSGVPRLNALRFSRRSALDIFGTFEEDRLGYLEQIKKGRGYSDKVQKKTEGRPHQGCAAAQQVMDR